MRPIPMPRPTPRLVLDDAIPAPSSMTVAATPRVVLYAADGTPLTRPIGYTT